MKRQFWLSLPVKDVKISKAFFTKMGFEFNTNYPETEQSASLMLGEHGTVVMLFEESMFRGFCGNEISDAKKSNEVLLSIDAFSKEEVDTFAQKAIAAGGISNHKPYEMTGWMYGCVFSDPDGHKWNVLYMDMGKMPKQAVQNP
ncbi:MAG: extradiol dioxygenase [Bacteroidetes bacterium]|nr:extradiol dioxygenase [Bacteroidota bacterium]